MSTNCSLCFYAEEIEYNEKTWGLGRTNGGKSENHSNYSMTKVITSTTKQRQTAFPSSTPISHVRALSQKRSYNFEHLTFMLRGGLSRSRNGWRPKFIVKTQRCINSKGKHRRH